MVSFRRVVSFCVLAAFAPEIFAALRWALGALREIGGQPAVQALGRSGLGLLAESALIWGALWLARRLAGRVRRPAPREEDASSSYPADPDGFGGEGLDGDGGDGALS